MKGNFRRNSRPHVVEQREGNWSVRRGSRESHSRPVAMERREFWREEIDYLLERSYRDIDDAVRALAERVCTRLNFASGNADTVRFVVEVFENDPLLKEELAEILEIKAPINYGPDRFRR